MVNLNSQRTDTNSPKEFYICTLFYPHHLFHFVLNVVLENQIPLLELEGKLCDVDSILISDLLVQNEQL